MWFITIKGNNVKMTRNGKPKRMPTLSTPEGKWILLCEVHLLLGDFKASYLPPPQVPY